MISAERGPYPPEITRVNDIDLSGKVAIVTGSSRGIGRAIALGLASHKASIVLNSTNNSILQAEDVKSEIERMGQKAIIVSGDVSKEQTAIDIATNAIKELGHIDILVNNAGIFQPKPALEITEEDWDKMIDIDLKGEFLCAQRAAKEMAKNKWGRIINIASIASGGVGVGISGGCHYTAAKGGVIGMTETMAIEWAPLGITVNAIGPGAIDTPMVSGALTKEATDALLAGVPLKRIGKAEEVSAAVIFLASEEASYVTGATFYVDGGWLAA